MMTSRFDLSTMPKKRVTTYGKASRRKAQTSDLFSMAQSATPGKTTTRPVASPPSSGSEPEPPRRVAKIQRKPNPVRKFKRSGRPEDSSTAHSQPLPGDIGMEGATDDSTSASKKRKLTRSQSENREMSAGVYSTPDSSPTGPPGIAELDAIYDIESPPRKNSRWPATTSLTALPELKVLKKKAIPIPASELTHDPFDFDDSDDEPTIRARSTAQTANTTSKPASRVRTKPSSNARPTSTSTQRKQEEIPLRLSRNDPTRPTGITKSKPPATTRQIAQAKSGLQTRQMAQVNTATQPRKPSQSNPAGPSSPPLRAAAHQPVPEPRVKVVVPPAPARTGRTRLIDALAAQVEESSSEGEQDESQPAEAMAFSPFGQPSPQAFGPGTASAPSPVKPRTIVRAVSLVKKSGLKFTYGMARTTTLDDDDLVMGGLGSLDHTSSSKGPLFDLEQMKAPASAFSFVDEDEEMANTGAVRSVHELRQAGASSRFADDMSDILDRIGAPSDKPSSLRRGALFELAEKLQEKDFRRQFRTHGSGSLFQHLAKETDIVAGYTTACVLVTLLGTLPSDHLIQQLASQGIADLLMFLLIHNTDIRVIARDRKSNVSKHGQKTLLGIKDALLKMSIWDPAPPSALSPRTLALKCAEMMLRQTSNLVSETKIFTTSVTELLFSILSAAVSEETYWDFPARSESTDFYLALFLLESHSITAMQSELALTWTEKYVPCIANILEVALNRPAEKLGDLEGLVLRLVLNTTNNNSTACAAFAGKGLLRGVTDAASRTFSTLSASIQGDAFQSTVFDSLVLMLGVLINFCEHYPPSAQDLVDASVGDESPASRLIRVFLDYHSKTTDADSMEKGKLNVAFGYLSVALGYFCLHEDIRDKFERLHTKRTIAPLLNAIREFVRFHEMAAPTMEGAEPGRSDHAMLLVEKLVDRLETRR